MILIKIVKRRLNIFGILLKRNLRFLLLLRNLWQIIFLILERIFNLSEGIIYLIIHLSFLIALRLVKLIKFTWNLLLRLWKLIKFINHIFLRIHILILSNLIKFIKLIATWSLLRSLIIFLEILIGIQIEIIKFILNLLRILINFFRIFSNLFLYRIFHFLRTQLF